MSTSILLLATFSFQFLHAQDEVTFVFKDGIEGDLKTRMEQNVSRLLTAINRAESTGRDINYNGIEIDGLASQSIGMMWNNVHMRIKGNNISEYCLKMKANGKVTGYQARNISVRMKPLDNSYEGDLNQKVCIYFDQRGRISDFNIEIGIWNDDTVFKEGVRLNDMDRRMQILHWVEQFRNAYVQKDINFMKAVFSDDALIITGKVMIRDNRKVNELTRQNKQQYLAGLQRVFKRNSFINVKFDEIEILRHPANPDFYGVTLKQGWYTKNYSDQGIVLLIWDFTDEERPTILVRTWQPMNTDNPLGIQDFPINN